VKRSQWTGPWIGVAAALANGNSSAADDIHKPVVEGLKDRGRTL